jgi:hypothetical protein
MSSTTSEARKPRRKWGWIFVVLFLLQAVVFLALIANTSMSARQMQSLADSAIRSGDTGRATLDSMYARGQRSQVNTLMVAFGVVSLITIGGAVIGFQRKK